jgi:molybdate/tungstate transport system substrate-binding protein
LLIYALAGTSSAHASDPLTPLQVAYAASMGSMMDGGVKPAIAKSLGAELQGRAQGSTGLANLIVAGSIRPDVSIPVTPGPMRAVLKVDNEEKAIPIARTEMVIAYSPKSQFASDFAKSGQAGAKPWWQILETPVRFGRTDPEYRSPGTEHHIHDAACGHLVPSA